MTPLIIAAGEQAPPNSLGVDGDPAGCAALYSHWRGHPPPAEIAADTATAILLRASLQADRWLAGFDHCVNTHIDCDGLLAMALACEPGYGLQFGPLVVGAAAYGDFNSWPGEDSARLAMRIHQLIASETAAGAGWEQRCADTVVADLPRLVSESQEPDNDRDDQIDQIVNLRHGFMGQEANFPLQLVQRERHSIIAGYWTHGHHPTDHETVYQRDDCPPWALDGFVPEAHHRLLLLAGESGPHAWLEAPPHSWAETVRLPQVTWPDCSGLAEELTSQESGQARWIAGDAAREHGFTCLLTCVDADGASAASSLTADAIDAAVTTLLQ